MRPPTFPAAFGFQRPLDPCCAPLPPRPRSKHLCIGGIYVRLLLETQPHPPSTAAAASHKSVVERLPAPKEFFAAAHHRLLCLGDASLLPLMGATGGAPSAGGGGGGGGGGGRRWDADGDRELCVRAMAAAYHAHAGAIGAIEGIPHLAALLDATPSRALRQHLLLLFEALVAPSCLAPAAAAGGAPGAAPAPPARHEAAARAAHANGAALLEAGGVQLMVDVVAGGCCLPAAA